MEQGWELGAGSWGIALFLGFKCTFLPSFLEQAQKPLDPEGTSCQVLLAHPALP